MKKSLIILILITLLISGCSSKKKGFELRNGIMFGDSIETVRKKEKLEVKEPETDEDEVGVETLRTEDGTIANIENSSVSYKFKDGKLYQMIYNLGDYHTESDSYEEVQQIKDYVTEQYNTIDKTLTEKYGDPIPLEKGTALKFHSDIYEDESSFEWLRELGLDAELVGIDERLYECEDGSHVVIDNKAAYLGNPKGYIAILCIGYIQVPGDEWDAIMDNEAQKQKNINDDL